MKTTHDTIETRAAGCSFQWKEGAQGRVVVDALVGRSKVG